MNSLERAKRFISQKASRLALTVVPLAALTALIVPANASVVFGTGPSDGACTTTAVPGGGGSCFTFLHSDAGGNPEANWVGMAGSGSVPDGGSVDLAVTNGTASGSLDAGTVPVSWDFTVDLGGVGPAITVAPQDVVAVQTFSYSVFFELTVHTSAGDSFPSFSFSGSSAPGLEIQGSNVITENGGDVTGYQIILNTSANFGYTLVVPGPGSLDLNPVSAVPEPSTALLILPGAGALLFLRRFRLTRQS